MDWSTPFKCFLLLVVFLELLNITGDTVIFGEGTTNKKKHGCYSSTSSSGVPTVSSWSDILLQTANTSTILLSFQNHSYWGNNEICDTVSDDSLKLSAQSFGNSRKTLLNLTFSCNELFHTSGLGTGNWISALYAIRLAVVMAGGNSNDLLISCTDALENKHKLILPWIMGFWRPDDVLSQILDGTRLFPPPKEKVCGGYNDVPLAYMLPLMKYELRRMAIALIGVPNADHPSARFAEKYLWAKATCGNNEFQSVMQIPSPKKDEAPLYENILTDDAIVHFRCGDLMFSRHPSFGFMKFSGFSKWISPSARSIGIVTQPFEVSGQTRKEDSGASKRQKCKDLVLAFTKHLTDKFPRAQISIYNDLNETIALSFARMIMANQTIVGISSFGVFPALTSFGIGYIRKPDHQKQPNQWLLDPLVDAASNGILLIEEPNLLWVSQLQLLRKIGGEPKVIEWFKNDTFCLGTEGLKCKT